MEQSVGGTDKKWSEDEPGVLACLLPKECRRRCASFPPRYVKLSTIVGNADTAIRPTIAPRLSPPPPFVYQRSRNKKTGLGPCCDMKIALYLTGARYDVCGDGMSEPRKLPEASVSWAAIQAAPLPPPPASPPTPGSFSRPSPRSCTSRTQGQREASKCHQQ